MAKMFIQDTTLTDIAKAIREKTGKEDSICPKYMASYIRSIQTSTSTADYTGYPDYVIAEGERVAEEMVKKRGGNSITAILLSDSHDLGDNDTVASTIEKYRNANRNAGLGAKVIADNIDVDFVAHLGDFCFGSKNSTMSDFVQGIANAKSYLNEVAKNHEMFYTPGNHDTATYGFAQNNDYLSQGALDALIGTYRYVDFDTKKVRVICLNTAEVEGLTVSGASGTHRITGTQLQWFANALDLSSKSDAENWGIVIMSHAPLDWDENILPAANCLQAYIDGSNFSVTHNGVAVSKNFSGKNAAKVICQFHGHLHCFRVDNIRYGSKGNLQLTNIKRIAIPNTYPDRTNEYGENGKVDFDDIEFGEETSYEKVLNTEKDTSFCLVSIDLDNEIIYADCYGAGYDRIISYGVEEVVTYTITNNITNARNSNTTASIVEGSPYFATIIADNGYEVSSIKVTMVNENGTVTDITSSAVSGNNITIANVTGNIVITATAVIDESPETGNYTNLVLTALDPKDSTKVFNGTGTSTGYKDNSYVNRAAEGTITGYVSTGGIYMPSGVQSIYVRGCEWDETIYTRFYNSSKETPSAYQSHIIHGNGSGDNSLSDFFTLTPLGEKYFKLTVKSARVGSDFLYNRYYRMSLKGSGADLIITHDQPIPEDATGGGTVTTYSVTNSLTNVTNSNSTASVVGGVSYSATLTANSGYTLTGGTVKITMGGTDITSSAYSNGKITIAQVTGNIVITATAVVEQSTTAYTNQVPISTNYNGIGIFNADDTPGYKNDSYVSFDSPYYKGCNQGCCVTGLIPYNSNSPKTIYIKGVGFTTAQSHNRIGFFKGGVCKTTQTVANLASYFTITTLGTNYYKLVPITSSAMTTWGYDGGIAISAYGNGANMIVTLDEPIE